MPSYILPEVPKLLVSAEILITANFKGISIFNCGCKGKLTLVLINIPFSERFVTVP